MCILLPLWRSEQMESYSGSNSFQQRYPVESRSFHQQEWQSEEEEEDRNKESRYGRGRLNEDQRETGSFSMVDTLVAP